MRDPLVELGIAVVGQAIRDWRLESKSHNWKPSKRNQRIKEITQFFNSSYAQLLLTPVDADAKALLEKLLDENKRKREEYEKSFR